MAQNYFNLILSLVSLSGLSLILYFLKPWNFGAFNTQRITAKPNNPDEKNKFEKSSRRAQEDEKLDELNVDNEEELGGEEIAGEENVDREIAGEGNVDREIADGERFEEIFEIAEESGRKNNFSFTSEPKEIDESEKFDEKQRLVEEERLLNLKKKFFEEKQTEGTKKFKEGQFEEALTLFNDAMQILEELTSLPAAKQSNYEISLFNNRSAVYERLKQFDLALQDCVFVLSNDPNHIKTRGRKARIHKEQGELKSALKELCVIQKIQQMQQESYEPPKIFMEIIEELSEKLAEEFATTQEKPIHGSYTKRKSLMSFSIIEKLISQVHNWEIYEIETKLEEETDLRTKAHLISQRALVLIHQNKFETVKTELETAAQYLLQLEAESKDPEDDESEKQESLFWAILGIFRSFDNEFESAFEAFERSVKLDPSNLDMWVIYATSSFESDLQKSKQLFEKANTISPKNADFYFHRAQHAVVSRDLATAKKDAELALACDPNNFSAKALCYQLMLETMDPAMGTIFEDLMADTDHPDLLALKAHICLSAQQTDEVLRCADKIHTLEPDNPISFMLKAQCLFQDEKFEDALMLLEQAFRLEPTTDILLQIAQIKLSQLENLDDSEPILELYRQAIRLSVASFERKEAAKIYLITEARIEATKALGLTKFS